MSSLLFKSHQDQPNCWNCIYLQKRKETDPYSCAKGNILTPNIFPEDWCIDWCKNGIKRNVTQYIEVGFYMFDFNDRLPEDGQVIAYLLGNGMDKNVRMVYGTFNREFLNYGGDFAKDENGRFLHVSYWRVFS